jgi:hypothetical protein
MNNPGFLFDIPISIKMVSKMKIDPIKRGLELRPSLVKGEGIDKELLVVDFTNTLQGKDTSKIIDTMKNPKGNYVFRVKCNEKSIDPLAVDIYGKDFFDVSKHSSGEIMNHMKMAEFDFAIWPSKMKGYAIKRVADYNLPIIIQAAGCDFHDGSETGGCWYCFVDDKSNDGIPGNGKTYMSVSDFVEGAKNARSIIRKAYKERANFDINPKVIRVSGGEPTLALDYVLETWREIRRQGLDFIGQLDSNLSTGKIVNKFEEEGIYEDNILKKLAGFNKKNPIKVLAAIKGISNKNFEDNVQSYTTLDDQMVSLVNFLEAGLDIYPQMYNPDPMVLPGYLKTMDGRIENFSKKIHIGPLKIYSPTEKRLTCEANRIGKDPKQFIAEKKAEWDYNYSEGCKILDSYLHETYGVGYREIPRPEVKLKLL